MREQLQNGNRVLKMELANAELQVNLLKSVAETEKLLKIRSDNEYKAKRSKTQTTSTYTETEIETKVTNIYRETKKGNNGDAEISHLRNIKFYHNKHERGRI